MDVRGSIFAIVSYIERALINYFIFFRYNLY